ncbi:MAG: hydroxyacylglutathione hydrolase, partial [Shewanella sp.]
AGVLVTHHHRDHTGGIAELIAYAQHTKTAPLQVYGPDNDSILGVNFPIDPNISPELSLPFINSKMQVLSIPGHTIDHLAYVIEDALFCGDTLFSAGCGRLFEGTAAQMFDSLAILAQLPPQTKVYCAHEYTLANLQFALTVDSNNLTLQHYLEQVTILRTAGKSSIPSNIALEKAINPFLRTSELSVINSVNQHFNNKKQAKLDTLTCFTLLRQWKNIF